MNDRTPKRRAVRWLLALYPAAWRERYAEEFLALLEDYPLSLLGVLDVLLGALDAHLHADAMFGRMIAMLERLRATAITVFCAYIAFVVAGLAYAKLTEDTLSQFNAYQALALTFHTIQAGSVIALLAVLAGGLPIALAAVRQAMARRRWRPLLLFAVPPVSLAVWLGYTLVLVDVVAPTTDLSIHTMPGRIAGLAWIALFQLAAVASTAAVVVAVRQSDISPQLYQFAARIPAVITTLAMAVMCLATIAWGLALRANLPQIFNGDQGFFWLGSKTAVSWLVIVVVMALATAIAAAATLRGLSARPEAGPSSALARQRA